MIRIGTRGSELALWQARKIADRVRELGEAPELTVISTRGDRIEDVPLTAELGRSFFTKEIEEALLSNEIDLAVHSLKDLAVEQPEGLCLAAVLERASSGERLLMRPDALDREAEGGSGIPLGRETVVGTSSPRRRRRLLELRPDLRIRELRGNVPTRVRKLLDGQYDAVLLACAGLDRLGIRPAGLTSVDLPEWVFPGAPGQGALGIQCRENDSGLRELLARIDDRTAALLTRTERSLLAQLGGGCNLPLGCHCDVRPEGGYRLAAFVFPQSEEHASLLVDLSGEDPEELAREAAATLGLALSQPLRGRSLLLLGGLERPGLAPELASAGASVQHVVCFESRARELDEEELDWILGADHLMLASRTAIAILKWELNRRGRSLQEGSTLLVPGPSSLKLAQRLHPDHLVLVGNPPRSEGMGGVAASRGARQAALLGAVDGNTAGLEVLHRAGIPARQVALYENVEVPVRDEDIRGPGATPLYMSPAAVRSIPPARLPAELYLALGPSTGRALTSLAPERIRVARAPELRAVVELLLNTGESGS